MLTKWYKQQTHAIMLQITPADPAPCRPYHSRYPSVQFLWEEGGGRVTRLAWGPWWGSAGPCCSWPRPRPAGSPVSRGTQTRSLTGRRSQISLRKSRMLRRCLRFHWWNMRMTISQVRWQEQQSCRISFSCWSKGGWGKVFYMATVSVPIRDVWAVRGGQAELPCDISPPDPSDQVRIVLTRANQC